jgi:hypothetical protein
MKAYSSNRSFSIGKTIANRWAANDGLEMLDAKLYY